MVKNKNIRKIVCCIMLFILIQTKVFAVGENLNYQDVDENGNLKIYSESAILIENETGKILYEKNAYDRKYPASTTKIMTAILALENCDLNEYAVASDYAVNSVKSGYTKADIQVGESFTVEELLNVVILRSANEAATILAEHISGSVQNFSKLMNEKAKEIGCQNTNFENANGAHSDNHYSTAYDMALIARYCMKNEKFREICGKLECSLPQTDKWQEERKFKNTNSLMLSENKYYYPYCTGIKTGFTTPAKNCLISSAKKDDFEVIAVVLHAESTENGLSARYLDTINMFNYGYNNYNFEDIKEEYDMIGYVSSRNQSSRSEGIVPNTENNDEILTKDVNQEKGSIISINKDILQICIGITILSIILFKMKINIKKKKRESQLYKRMYQFKYEDIKK